MTLTPIRSGTTHTLTPGFEPQETIGRPPPSGHEFVVVSHRLPVDIDADGGWQSSTGALAAALRPVAAARLGGWIGGDAATQSDTRPFAAAGVWLHRLPLSGRDERDFLQGQCESTIAPIYHDAVLPPTFERRWREAYRSVNKRFAEAAARITAPGGVVWVHDYHLQLVPATLRRLRPDLLICCFLHVPFPPVELFMQMPLRTEIAAGLLGADLVGFQTRRSAENFLAVAAALLDVKPGPTGVEVDGRRVTVDAFPQSVDTDGVERLATAPETRAATAALRAGLGGPHRVLLAVDRLHPAKGIEQRLTAYGELLTDGRLDPAETVLIQVAAPGTVDTRQQRDLRARVERQVGQINGQFGQVGRPAVHYLHRAVEPTELAALYLAADVMLATPLRDGMSLTAKEYVAARTDGSGALVLSEFTAAATDLPEAFIVNPHDIDALKQSIVAAATAVQGDLRWRMTAMREQVFANDVRQWAGHLLAVLGQSATAMNGRQGTS